jgi:acylglycerol lipase
MIWCADVSCCGAVEHKTVSFPPVPDRVVATYDTFENAQGLKLQTFRFEKKNASPVGLVWLCHGYSGHSTCSWFLPSAPGQPHDQFDGGILANLVDSGYVVGTLDHQSHGHSEGLRGLRCYFDAFDDLPKEALGCLEMFQADTRLSGLPTFALGISMGGACAVRMSQLRPTLFRGVVLLAPMLSLENIQKTKVFLGITNGHLARFASSLDYILPTLPVGKRTQNTMFPDTQKELEDDPLVYHGDIRVRTAKCNLELCSWFMNGGLEEMTTPFLTIHAAKDTFVDPDGSQALLDRASSKDKTYLRVGAGLDIDEDMWHGLTSEPGSEMVMKRAVEWIQART